MYLTINLTIVLNQNLGYYKCYNFYPEEKTDVCVSFHGCAGELNHPYSNTVSVSMVIIR